LDRFKGIYIQSLVILTRIFTITTREGIQETHMQFLNSKITLLENTPSRNVQTVMIQAIIHNYHNHSDNTKFHIQETIKTSEK